MLDYSFDIKKWNGKQVSNVTSIIRKCTIADVD